MKNVSLLLMLLLPTCTHKNTESDMKKDSSKKVIADMDSTDVLPTESALTLAGYKIGLTYLPEDNLNWLTIKGNELIVRYSNQDFILPVKLYLNSFLNKDTTLSCHQGETQEWKDSLICLGRKGQEKDPFIKMRLFARIQDLSHYFKSPDAQFVLHFCGIKAGSLMIAKNNYEFWDEVHQLRGHTKSQLYAKSNEVHLKGVVLVISYNEEGSLVVSDYRVSLGPVKKGSLEEKEFVNEDCLQFTGHSK